MIFVSHYDSPLGILYLAADKDGLKGVWFEGQKYFASGLEAPAYDPIREDDDLRRNRQKNC